jgi:HD-GYP domain-containing protein (c-di-GMP phosphodiesterase class II)
MGQEKKQSTRDTLALKSALRLTGRGADNAGARQPVAHNQLYDPAVTLDKGASRGAIRQANELLKIASVAMAQVVRSARKKEPVDIGPLKEAVNRLVDNCARSPNALLWALATNKRMHYLNRRSIGCAVLALAFGRFLGYERAALHDLALGAMLLDLGKISVPVTILAKIGVLSEAEQHFTRRHVDESIRILESMSGLTPNVIEMVRSHHERYDGKGYPAGLKGDEIPQCAKIAGIVDTFDALCLNRYYAQEISGYDALGKLNSERGRHFDAELVDKFICAIGVFPTGSWVEFENGSMGIVYLQNPHDPMCPHVALIADESKRPFLAVRWLTLTDRHMARAMRPAERPPYAAIMEHSLQSTVYGFVHGKN